MNVSSTKYHILLAAMDLFAHKGYDAVRVAQIADAVGIKAPSLYKHFKSKQAIFDAILAEMQERYHVQMSSLQMDGRDPARESAFFANADIAQLITIAKNLFLYYLHDEFAAPFRRMLAVEQFHNPQLADLYTKQYIEDPLSFQGSLFGLLISSGHMKPVDSRVMALHFYAPVFLLLTLCDCQPDMENDALELIEKSVIQFERLYRIAK